MTSSLILGILLVALSGVLIGLFSIPVTKTPRWNFEHIWGVGSLIALIVLPWPLALSAVPSLGRLYQSVPTGVLVTLALCGIGWGVGGIFWGKSIEALGMALGVSLLLGLVNVFSSVGPLAIFEPAKLSTAGGLALIGAVCVMLGGTAMIALAGKYRMQEQSAEMRRTDGQRKSLAIGLIFCLLSGIPSTLPNFAFIFGRSLAHSARVQGASAVSENFPMWAIVFTGNYTVNALYALVIMIRRGTWRTLLSQSSPAYWTAGIFMGLAWPGGILVYGIGVASLGRFGPYVGYPMMILSSLLAGNLAGAFGGEWIGSRRKSRLTMLLGVLVTFGAFALLTYANRLLSAG